MRKKKKKKKKNEIKYTKIIEEQVIPKERMFETSPPLNMGSWSGVCVCGTTGGFPLDKVSILDSMLSVYFIQNELSQGCLELDSLGIKVTISECNLLQTLVVTISLLLLKRTQH